jgi:TRAP-type transport system large permease protein
VARITMDQAFKGVLPFLYAQLIVLFSLVAFPQLVMTPLKWWLR